MRIAITLVACALVMAAGCRQQSVAPTPTPAPTPAAKVASQATAAAAPADPTRLPEDPVAAKLSEQQWREHMVEEEEERQIAFDRNRLKAHRALVKLIAAARSRYDHARTEAAVAKVRSAMPAQIAELRRRVTEIDHWGVNSRLLQDYDALATALAASYPEAKTAALKGDAHAFEEARAGFDQHMHTIADWLAKAAATEGEDEDRAAAGRSLADSDHE